MKNEELRMKNLPDFNIFLQPKESTSEAFLHKSGRKFAYYREIAYICAKQILTPKNIVL